MNSPEMTKSTQRLLTFSHILQCAVADGGSTTLVSFAMRPQHAISEPETSV